MAGLVSFLNLPAQQARLGKRLKKRVDRVLEHCQFVMGPEIGELEEALSHYSRARHAIAVSSGTDALLITLMAENIGPDMAVFLPAFTYTATAEVVLLLGAVPVFVDIEPHTFQISLSSLKERYQSVLKEKSLKPAAIIAVDLFGQPAPWDELKAFAAETDLLIIGDCAQSFGASYKGRTLGQEARVTTLSFFPSKPLGCYGDGGAILTNDDAKAELYRSLRSHGEGKERYDVQRIGLNARLDTIQAAVLLAKLEVFNEELAQRDSVARYYDAHLPECVIRPERVENSQSAWAVYCVTLPSQHARDSLKVWLTQHQISSAIYYPKPLHHQPAYKNYHDGVSLPVAEAMSDVVLALPIHPDLTEEEQERVVKTIQNWAEHYYD